MKLLKAIGISFGGVSIFALVQLVVATLINLSLHIFGAFGPSILLMFLLFCTLVSIVYAEID